MCPNCRRLYLALIVLSVLVLAAVIWHAETRLVTVYVTPTGGCYHRADCRHLRGSTLTMPAETAEARGLSPCRSCLSD